MTEHRTPQALEASSWERGTCPRCHGPEVVHHEIGMPLAEAVEAAPAWVLWSGCCGVGPDRECLDCAHRWWADEVGWADPDEDAQEGGTAPPPLRVVGAVVVDGEHVLAARRAPGSASAGRWEFPGGKIERGESPRQALARELREELGIVAEVGWLIGRGRGVAGERQLDLDCYWVRVRGEAPTTSTDHDLLQWVSRSRIADREWAEADVPIVREILAGAAPRFGAA